MNTPTSILVPTDFSENANQALGYARQIATSLHTELHLLHVMEPAPDAFVDIEKELHAKATHDIGLMVERLKAEGFTARGEVRTGRASEEICSYASEHAVYMICIGTHGHSGFDRFVFGSTTDRVLRTAPCPVLSVRLQEMKTD